MPFRYYGSVIPGLQETAAAILTARLPGTRIRQRWEGALIFESPQFWDGADCFCLNNLFLIISAMEHLAPLGALESHIKKVLREQPPLPSPPKGPGQRPPRSFRILLSRENIPAAVDEKSRGAAEAFIAARTGLRVNRSGADTEFWFLYRREGRSFFMRRLTGPAGEKPRRPGELPAPLAYMMCWLSSPQKGDRVMDPFCGYGAIPEQRLKHFPLERFYAFDRDRRALEITRAKLGAAAFPRLTLDQTALPGILTRLPKTGVDAIITDPPWGLYAETARPLGEFYRDMIALFDRVLKPRGTMVLLTARREELTRALDARNCLTLRKTIPILVSGQKAGIFIIKKGGPGISRV
jgi:hypothetical protein